MLLSVCKCLQIHVCLEGQVPAPPVSSAFDTKTGLRVAVKKLSRPFQSIIHAKRTYRELRLLKHMKHENVIGLLDVFTPAKSLEEFNDVYLVTHLMGADLNNIVKCQKLTDDHVQFLIYQILRGLKILDFGLARHTDDEMTGYVATRWYRAPEIMLNWMHYNQTVDICTRRSGGQKGCSGALIPVPRRCQGRTQCQLQQLSCPGHGQGVPVIMRLTGTPPAYLINRMPSHEARNYIQSLSYMPKMNFENVFIGANPLAVDLLEKMLVLDTDKRITAAEALAHAYFAQYHDPDDEPVADPYDHCHLVGGGRITTVELLQLLLCISVTPSEELRLTRAVLHTQPTITEVLGPDEPREVVLIPTRQLLPIPTAADLRKEKEQCWGYSLSSMSLPINFCCLLA
ncbi:hypothetical protein IHE44_0008382 [Lamprotornis superbus]|uniref:mitogen-activated protein kinase n=1 Tax=Lamprotornis superbus TaxID=245042 RepID=A0A835NKF9_9PASS|nr:hypothetical protein IHE44_0008382 [Lamprotornis superbus]